MRKLKWKSVSNLLKNNTLITKKQLDHAQGVHKLSQIVGKMLPYPLNTHCRVANMTSDRLVIATDSPAWRARLRFFANPLLHQLEQDYSLKFKKLKVIIVKSPGVGQSRIRRRPTIPSENVTLLLHNLAEQMDDEALKSSLLRLSRHIAKRDSQ